MGAYYLPSIAFKNKDAYNYDIERAAKKYGVPRLLIKGVIATESGFNENAQAKTTSARGLMQLTKGAAQDTGVDHDDLFVPQINIDAGAKYLMQQRDRFRNWRDAIAAYYAGGGTINRAKKDAAEGKEISNLAKDGYAYANKVFAYAAAFALDLGEWV